MEPSRIRDGKKFGFVKTSELAYFQRDLRHISTVLDRDDVYSVPGPARAVVSGAVRLGPGRVAGRKLSDHPLAVLKASKSVPREDPADAAKDRADFEALTERYGEGTI